MPPRVGVKSGPESGASVPTLSLPLGAKPGGLPGRGSGGRRRRHVLEARSPPVFPTPGLSAPSARTGSWGCHGEHEGASTPLSTRGKPHPWSSYRLEVTGTLEYGATWALPSPREGAWDTSCPSSLPTVPRAVSPGHWAPGAPAAAES